MKRKISCQISGAQNYGLEADGAIKINYVYISGSGDTGFTGKTTYDILNDKDINEQGYNNIIAFNYTNENSTKVNIPSPEYGLYRNESGAITPYSIYRREYVENPDDVSNPYYVGEWEPVVVQSNQDKFRDYNITSGRHYQYALFPSIAANANILANDGEILSTQFNCWSLTELIPAELDIQVNTPTIKKLYKVDENQVWLFKYNVDFGSQSQVTSKTEQQTLGKFSRFSHGLTNHLSGSVTALLGSEIVPYSKTRYVERMRNSFTNNPLTSNQRVEMLEQWRNIVYSKNPKLLKDMKGQSWIVQITNGSNTPKAYVQGNPDSINFSWSEIEDTENIGIIGDIKLVKQGDYPCDEK